MSFDVDKFGRKSGIELNTLNAGMKKADIDKNNTAGKSIFDAIDIDNNGVIDEQEISMFKKDIDTDGDNTISKKEATKYLESKEFKDTDKKEILKFLAEMIKDTENVKEVKILEKDGKKLVQVTYNNGSVDLVKDDKSYSRTLTDENGNEITEEYNADNRLEKKTTKAKNDDITVTEYEQDGKTVKQEVSTTTENGEVTTTKYLDGKLVSKDVKRGVATTHYEIDAEGKPERKSEIARAEARARAEKAARIKQENERIKQEAASRKKVSWTEKKANTYRELAENLYKGEGVAHPTKAQINARIKDLKETNPNIKDGELKGKRVTVRVARKTYDRISAKNKKTEAAKQNTKLQKASAKQITDELIKATRGLNDEKAIKKALAKIDDPAELKEVERQLEARGYKRDQYYSPIEKFMYKEMSGAKFYDKSFDDMEGIVKKWISNGTLTGEDAINAQARLAARLIIDGCDGFGTDVDETKEGIRLIKAPKSTGNAKLDKANAKKVYNKVNNIIKNHKSFGAGFKGLTDYLSGDLWASEIKYL